MSRHHLDPLTILPAILALAALLIVGGQANAGDRITVRDSEQLRAAVLRAGPGTVIALAPGTYGPGVRLEGLAGKQGEPIVIEGTDPKRPPVFEGGKTALHLVDCSFVTLRNITVKGCSDNGINIDDGGSMDSPAHHIVLENITVLDTGPQGNRDGIKLSGLDDFALRNCRVAGWGGSAIDMVGCHRGVIEDCVFEGKQGFSQSSGVQMKGGSKDVVVQGCFFENAGLRSINLGGSTGPAYFRPQDARFEAEDITVAGNRFTGSMAFVAFVNSSNARVHHNTMYMSDKWILRILQETDQSRFPACRDGVFEHNLIVFDRRVRSFVNVGPGTAPETFTFRSNAWFQTDGGTRPRLPGDEEDGVYQIDPGLENAGTRDMRATSTDRRLRGIGARAYVK